MGYIAATANTSTLIAMHPAEAGETISDIHKDQWLARQRRAGGDVNNSAMANMRMTERISIQR